MHPSHRLYSHLAFIACALTLFVSMHSAHAQAPESELPARPGEFEGRLPAPVAGGFLMPDIPHASYESTEVKSSWFTIKPGLVMLGDYTWFK